MNTLETVVKVIHSDRESGRFVVMVTEHGDVVYSHWRSFQLAGHTKVQVGAGFRVCLGLDMRDNETLIVKEVYGGCDAPEIPLTQIGLQMPQCEQLQCSGLELLDALKTEDKLTLISNVAIDEGCEFSGLEINGSVVLADCDIRSDFRWLKARVRGSLWFLNCRFSHHFSLKSSVLDGSVVFFGCDFTGPGGISLRGVRACSVLMEFGTRGSDDMLWLNEMTLRGCLALNGTFEAPVQLLARQDDAPVNASPGLRHVFIGCQSYFAERLSRNRFNGGVVFEGYDLSGDLEVRRSGLLSVRFAAVACDHLVIDSCEVDQDVILEGIVVNDENRGIAITDSVIGRHLRMSGTHLRGFCCLAGTSVGYAWRLELEHPEQGTPRLDLERFHAEHAWFEPVRLIYGDRPVKRFAKPPAFGLLAREHLTQFRVDDRRHLAEAYTRFKNWMAGTGHLREEDYAFFYMRHYKEADGLVRWLLGGVFGWGIRFRNILISALLLTALFSLRRL